MINDIELNNLVSKLVVAKQINEDAKDYYDSKIVNHIANKIIAIQEELKPLLQIMTDNNIPQIGVTVNGDCFKLMASGDIMITRLSSILYYRSIFDSKDTILTMKDNEMYDSFNYLMEEDTFVLNWESKEYYAALRRDLIYNLEQRIKNYEDRTKAIQQKYKRFASL